MPYSVQLLWTMKMVACSLTLYGVILAQTYQVSCLLFAYRLSVTCLPPNAPQLHPFGVTHLKGDCYFFTFCWG